MRSPNVRSITTALAHHDGSPLYVSDPSPSLGDQVQLFIRTSAASRTRGVHVRATPDGEPTFIEAQLDRTDADETWWRVSLPVTNTEMAYRFLLDTPHGGRWLNGQGLHCRDVTDVADYRLSTYAPPPVWADGSVVYQIFPDRFARSKQHPAPDPPQWAIPSGWDEPVSYGTPAGVRQSYGGTLWGIAEKLDHIQGLGADAIYLTPFFPARSNHRYDAADFSHVDPLLGGDAALRELTAQADRRRLRVIGDITLNHSGNRHPWFLQGQADPSSAEAAFYFFEEDRTRYASFGGVPTLPKLDHRSPELRRRLYDGPDSVIARYLHEYGLAGWRVDVAQSAGRHGGTNFNAEMARLTRATMAAAKPDTLLLAEHQHDASSSLRGDGWHGTMAYAGFTRPVWAWLSNIPAEQFWGVPTPMPAYGGQDMSAVMADFAATIPWRAVTHNLTLLDSHDTPRFRSIAGRERQHLAAALMMTLPGLPMVFAGDEVGVEGVHNEDGRRPFPWDSSTWDHETYAIYRTLICLRHDHPALRSGGLRWLHTDTDVVVYERALPDQTLLIKVSRSAHEPVLAPVRGESLAGGPNLSPGAPMPSEGPAFHIWRVIPK
jgi:alpha-glucosidase